MVILDLYFYALFAAPAAVSDGKRSDYREDGLSADIKVPVKPVLSRELQVHCISLAICF